MVVREPFDLCRIVVSVCLVNVYAVPELRHVVNICPCQWWILLEKLRAISLIACGSLRDALPPVVISIR